MVANEKRALRLTICVGLILYNIYNLTSIGLMPDIVWVSAAMRLLVVTPIALLIAWLVGRVGPRSREFLALNGTIGSFLLPVLLFWITKAPLGPTRSENSLLQLFSATCCWRCASKMHSYSSGIAFSAAALAAATKPELDATLRTAFVIQIATACIFSLYANYRQEARRCRDYLVAMRARLDSESAEAARQMFQHLSNIDALTGLPNRRELDERLDHLCQDRRSLAAMMIDIDHFKLFNDVFGHPAGDDCLRKIAVVLGERSKAANALMARFGGEEFTCVAQDVGPLEAARIGRDLVKSIEALNIPHPGRSDGLGIVTISVGIALKPEGLVMTPDEMLSIADVSLYEAKRHGRNRFVFQEMKQSVVSAYQSPG